MGICCTLEKPLVDLYLWQNRGAKMSIDVVIKLIIDLCFIVSVHTYNISVKYKLIIYYFAL